MSVSTQKRARLKAVTPWVSPQKLTGLKALVTSVSGKKPAVALGFKAVEDSPDPMHLEGEPTLPPQL